jgi:SNF2 family DNA or RNA helicase
VKRLYGEVHLKDGRWHLTGDPHVLLLLKRVFARIWAGEHGTVTFQDTDEMRRKIEWFMLLYPMKVSPQDRKVLSEGSKRHDETILRLDELIDTKHVSRSYKMALPPRDYQKVAAEMALAQKGLLIADDLGVGKTVMALAMLTDKSTLPAVVVTLAGTMPMQWRDQTWKFLPDLHTHVVKKGTPYPLPKRNGRGPDLVIINYHKLSGWSETLAAYARCVIFDEVQELRRRHSNKYSAAEHIARQMKYACGLSATPIFNLGGEIWNIINVLKPDALGTWEEFLREWCYGENDNGRKAPAVKDPKALGSYLKTEHLMLRRTRKEVGRELPALTKIVQPVESDEKAFDEIEDKAAALARIILSTEKIGNWERMRAHEEFDNKMRQATGISKAPYVADFVRLLVEADDEPVLVFGWHRAVYDILLSKLKDLQPEMFTGSETAAHKQAALKKFIDGGTKILLMSLRAGMGLDGIQHRCRTVVFGELDWSPAVMDQDVGRVLRDGQPDPVTAFYLVSESGSDPIISETLGLKQAQLEGIRDPERGIIAELQTDKNRIRELAKHYLERSEKKTGVKV